MGLAMTTQSETNLQSVKKGKQNRFFQYFFFFCFFLLIYYVLNFIINKVFKFSGLSELLFSEKIKLSAKKHRSTDT